MLVNREVILAKIEGTYGVDAVPVEGIDAMLVENISWSQEGLRMNERPAVRASIGMLKQVFGGRLMTITFDVEMKGNVAAGTAPEHGPLLRACGLDETLVALTSAIYAPVSTGHESITIYYFQDGIRYNILGCRGNVSWAMEAGALGKMSFTFTGHLVEPTDVALATPVLIATVPVAILSGAFAIGGFSAIVSSLSFDLGNTLAMPPDINASDGFAEVQITGRDVNGSYDPESELQATENPHADLIAGTELALTIGPIGTVGGNIINVDFPAVAYRDLSPGDRDGIRTYEIPFGAAEATTDDEISIAYT
jgi:hypothetical protein